MKLNTRCAFSTALLACASFAPRTLPAQAQDRFTAYEHCRFTDDLALVENTPLPEGVEGRTVKTVMGPRQVPLEGGVRLMYGYPQSDFFANVKVEQIPASGYTQAKQDLVANFEQILTGDDSSTRNYALQPRLNGLEIYGLDRKKLEGGVLGIYLFFANRTHTATTIYFLNQDPAERKFSTLEEYAKLRDSFVNAYTSCAAGRERPPAQDRAAAADPAAAPDAGGAPGAAAPGLAAAPGTPALPDAPSPQGAAAVSAAGAGPTPAMGAAPAKTAAAASPARGSRPGVARSRTAAKKTLVKTARAQTRKGTKKAAPAHPATKQRVAKPAKKTPQ